MSAGLCIPLILPAAQGRREPKIACRQVAIETDRSTSAPRERVDPPVIELELDENGAPVSIEPRGWFICFVPGLVKQWWHPFVNARHKHVFALRPDGSDRWTLFEPWWHRLLTATITPDQARKFLIWGARGDVLHARESVPGHGSQVRGWMTCATLAAYLLGRKYWVWTPHALYKLLLREPGVCRVDVSRLLKLEAPQFAAASAATVACGRCMPGIKPPPGAPKPFCMHCGRDLVPGWGRADARVSR